MKKILIVVDAQYDFIYGALKNEDAIKTIPNLVKKIRSFDGEFILATKDTHSEDYLKTKEGEKLPVVHCVKGTPGWELEPNVQSALTDSSLRNMYVNIIEKPTFGSFDLLSNIQSLVENDDELDITIVGYCTDICVVSNALMIKAAFFDRANVTVDASCCAGVTPDSHKAALETMKMCQINVVNE
jgi:nicotinamidase-related amidase